MGLGFLGREEFELDDPIKVFFFGLRKCKIKSNLRIAPLLPPLKTGFQLYLLVVLDSFLKWAIFHSTVSAFMMDCMFSFVCLLPGTMDTNSNQMKTILKWNNVTHL